MSKQPETVLREAIHLALGRDPTLLVLRNAQVYDRERSLRGGLGTGSPDLLVFLSPWGHAIGLEVKVPGKYATEDQRRCAAMWRTRGVTVMTVRSVEDAQKAVTEAAHYMRSRYGIGVEVAGQSVASANVAVPR